MPELSRWARNRPMPSVCTIWRATSGNVARIGTLERGMPAARLRIRKDLITAEQKLFAAEVGTTSISIAGAPIEITTRWYRAQATQAFASRKECENGVHQVFANLRTAVVMANGGKVRPLLVREVGEVCPVRRRCSLSNDAFSRFADIVAAWR